MPDIDIDFANRDNILDVIEHIPATIKNTDGTIKKHNTGVYCQRIPINPLTGTAAIEYKEAEDRGYFKLDFLNVSIYQGIKNEKHLTELVDREPLWDLLLEDEFTKNLFHVSGHGDALRKMQPKTLEQLAMVLAMIRPAKKHLMGQSWTTIEQEVWQKPKNDEYYFKKAHAISYALAVVVHMNLLCEQLSYEYS